MTVATYLATGGAGLLGINLVPFLMARGRVVRSLEIAAFVYPERETVTAIDGNIRDHEAVERAISGVEIAVHAAAPPLYNEAALHSAEIDGTPISWQ